MNALEVITVYGLLGAIALLLALPFVARRVGGEVLTPRFWFAAVAVPAMLLRPWYLLHHPEAAHRYLVSYGGVADLMVPGLLCIVVGLIALNVGYLSPAGVAMAQRLPSFNVSLCRRRWQLAILVSAVLGLSAYLFMLHRVGGLGLLLANLAGRQAFYQEAGVNLIRLGLHFNDLAVLLAAWYYLKVRRTKWFWAYMVLLTLLNLTTGSRTAVLTPWLFLYLLVAIDNARWRSWKVLVAVGLVFVVFATAYLAFRRSTRSGVGAELAAVTAETEALNPLELFADFDHLLAIIHLTPRYFAYQEGVTYLHVFALLLPQSVFSWQPRTVGGMLREAIEPLGQGGRPAGAIGEGYLNFGYVGVFGAMLVLGLSLRTLHSYGTYVAILESIFGFTHGIFSLNLRDLLIILALVALFVVFAGVRKRPEDRHSEG